MNVFVIILFFAFLGLLTTGSSVGITFGAISGLFIGVAFNVSYKACQCCLT